MPRAPWSALLFLLIVLTPPVAAADDAAPEPGTLQVTVTDGGEEEGVVARWNRAVRRHGRQLRRWVRRGEDERPRPPQPAVVAEDVGFTVPGATVVVRGPVERRTETDVDGRVEFDDLPPGTYVIEVTKDGFLPARQLDVQVRSGESTVQGVIVGTSVGPMIIT